MRRVLIVVALLSSALVLGVECISFRAHDGIGCSGFQTVRPISGDSFNTTDIGTWPTGISQSTDRMFSGGLIDTNASDPKLWMSPQRAEYVVSLSLRSGAMTAYNSWPVSSNDLSIGNGAFEGVVIDSQNRLWFCPSNSRYVLRVQTDSGAMAAAALPVSGPNSEYFMGCTFDGRYLWLAPRKFPHVVVVDTSVADTNLSIAAQLLTNSWPGSPFSLNSISGAFAGAIYDAARYVWFVPHNANAIVRLDALSRASGLTAFSHWPSALSRVGDAAFFGGVFDGTRFLWLIPYRASGVVRFDTVNLTAPMVLYNSWPSGWLIEDGKRNFAGGAYDGRYLWLAGHDVSGIVRLDTLATVTTPMRGTTTQTSPDNRFIGGAFAGNVGCVYFVPYSYKFVTRVCRNSTVRGLSRTFSVTTVTDQLKSASLTHTSRSATSAPSESSVTQATGSVSTTKTRSAGWYSTHSVSRTRSIWHDTGSMEGTATMPFYASESSTETETSAMSTTFGGAKETSIATRTTTHVVDRMYKTATSISPAPSMSVTISLRANLVKKKHLTRTATATRSPSGHPSPQKLLPPLSTNASIVVVSIPPATRSVATSAVAVGTASAMLAGPAGAADMQVVIVAALSSCIQSAAAGSEEGRFKLITPFALSDTAEGALAGNAIAVAAVASLSAGAAGFHRFFSSSATDMPSILGASRCPGAVITVFTALHQSTLYSSLQLTSQRPVVGWLTTVAVAVLLPSLIIVFAAKLTRRFVLFSIHPSSGNVTTIPWYLSRPLTLFRPVGVSVPLASRQMASAVITAYQSPSLVYVALPYLISLAVNGVSMPWFPAETVPCRTGLSLLAVVHATLAFVTAFLRPGRTPVANVMACAGLLVTSVFFGLLAAGHRGEWVEKTLTAQGALTLTRTCTALVCFLVERAMLKDPKNVAEGEVLWGVGEGEKDQHCVASLLSDADGNAASVDNAFLHGASQSLALPLLMSADVGSIELTAVNPNPASHPLEGATSREANAEEDPFAHQGETRESYDGPSLTENDTAAQARSSPQPEFWDDI